jgi:DNA-binding NtrC family response regulator
MTLPKGVSQPNKVIRNRIAVVYSEDELANCYAEIIRGGGYEVDVFTNPVLALEKIGSEHSIFLLAVIGWRMPRLTGPELALDLSKIDPGIKIILFSALTPSEANHHLDYIARTDNVKFDHFYQLVNSAELLEMINNKIKYGKCDDPWEVELRRLRKQSPKPNDPESKEYYLKTNDTHWRKVLPPWGGVLAGGFIALILVWLLQSLGF